MLNPFFQQGTKAEQGLIQDLINEQLRMYGVDVYYLPRQYLTKKKIIREVVESEFSTAFPIEAYIETYDGYEGAGTMFTKFGVQPMNDLSLTISKERYENYISPLIQTVPNIELSTRPKEGDLIYFPLGDRLFEIKFVDHEIPFYQLQKTYVYTLRCELFRYQDELIITGIDNIDDNTQGQGYSETFKMVGIGSTATAVASIVNGGVTSVTVINRGDGYITAPTVGFSSAPINGLTAAGIATMISGITDLCEPNPSLLRVQGVEIINAGYGYTVPPAVSFFGGGGSGARAIASIGDGVVGVITVTSGGSGYAEPPTVTFVGVASTAAQASAVVTNGSISEIRIINTGVGYTVTPQIIIGDPYMVGFGTFELGELVVGTASSITARVKSWNAVTNSLELSSITGVFSPGEILTGQTSGASYKIQDLREDFQKDPYPQNGDFNDETRDVIDFSETNPFGMP
jgi:hypothetical protein